MCIRDSIDDNVINQVDEAIDLVIDDAINSDATVDESFTYTTHQLMVAKLMFMLETWNAPKYAFQQIVEWYEEAQEKNISFHGNPVSRDANMKDIRRCVPNDLAAKLLPQTAPVDLLGFDGPVELVRFDMAEMILSLLNNPEVMQSDNLVVNANNPFDNGLCYNGADIPIGEPRTAKVYQDYLTANPPADNDFLFELIFYVDWTHIDINSRFSVCPLIFTSSLFTEKARKPVSYTHLTLPTIA